MISLKGKYIYDPVFSGTCFLIAFGIINIFALTLLLTSLTFILGGQLTIFHLPLAILIAFFVNYLVARSSLDQPVSWKVFVRVSLIIFGILIVAIVLVVPFYDISEDGMWYHQEAVIQMARGWNPFKGNLPYDTSDDGSLWFNHYAKGPEIFQASIYILTGKIETAKATLLFVATGAFCLSVYFIYGLQIFSKLKAAFVSGLLVLSPWVVSQLLTFCNDGQTSCLLLYALLTCCLIFREYKKHLIIMLCSVIITTINVKFTGILYIACFTGVLLIILLFRKKTSFRPVLLSVLLSGLAGILLVGFNPYVTNFVNNGHPFWPIMGKNKVDIITAEYPNSWRSLNRFQKLGLSLLTHTDETTLWANANQEVDLKIPFTFNKTDIRYSCTPLVKMGGFGPLFSGILLLSVILLSWTLLNPYPPEKRYFLLVVLATLAGTIFIMEEACILRYVPQFWFIPVIIALASEFSAVKNIRYLRNAIYICIVANICFSAMSIPYNFFQTSKVSAQLKEMKKNGQVIPVNFGRMQSNRIKFEEKNIPYKVVALSELPDSINPINLNHSFTRYLLPQGKHPGR
jgi:hypothetical protein